MGGRRGGSVSVVGGPGSPEIGCKRRPRRQTVASRLATNSQVYSRVVVEEVVSTLVMRLRAIGGEQSCEWVGLWAGDDDERVAIRCDQLWNARRRCWARWATYLLGLRRRAGWSRTKLCLEISACGEAFSYSFVIHHQSNVPEQCH
jgi:hypothetical protein